jgi:uncharacterized protein (TIGR03435 family)
MRPIAGGVSARNLSANMLIQSAYNLKLWQIFGGPDWMATEHYDIEAKAAGNPGLQENLEMFRPLLADRFQLKFHREMRQMTVYSLIVAKNGPKLQAAAPGTQGYIRPGRGLLEGKGVNNELPDGPGPRSVVQIGRWQSRRSPNARRANLTLSALSGKSL